MKLQRRNNTKIILIVIVAVLALAAIGFGIFAVVSSINAKKEAEAGKEIQQIIMSSYPDKNIYYVGESFDPKGAKIQVITKASSETSFVDYNQLTFSGFDSSVPSDKVTITVSYKGFTTTFDVVVRERESLSPTLTSIEVYNFETTYSLTEWNTYGPNSTGAKIKCIYSDGSVVEDIVLKDKYIFDVTKLSAAGTTQITIKYSDGVTTVELPVTITITN